MKRVTIFLFAAILFITAGEICSQSISLNGVSGGVSNDTIFVNQQVQFDIRINSEAVSYDGITNGFQVYSPEGAEWTTMEGDTLSLGWEDMFDLIYDITHFSVTGNGADTVGFGGAKMLSTGLPSTFNEIAYTITIGPIDPIDHKNHICLDSSFYQPAGAWKWAGPNAYPSWDGPHCYTIIDPSAPTDPSNIVLSPDYLDFTTIEGATAPPAQTFDVLTDQDPFNFTLNESASWIYISPIHGTSGQTITTTINPTGLTAGFYVDSIEIVAPTTDNSPQWMVITLEVEPPPPAIAVSPTSLFFNAVAGEANPSDKIISISNSNIGSSDLNWSVSNSESWLSLSPTSGVNSGDVILSVDITGLGYNDYYDTIVVTDPQASNNPVKIPVNLSVGSDLPLIAVDSAFNYIIVPSGVSTIQGRDIVVYNGGAGGMTYSLTENSTRIFTLNPISGTAPDTVAVGFKILGHNPGDDFIDTLWVHSDEAINSPFPVLFHFHYVEIPAEIVLVDTVEVDVYECDQGAFAINPQGYFSISNVAGGEPYTPQIDYESDLFTLELENNSIPEFVSVVAYDLQLPLGSYYDTITVSAINAVNSPQSIIVKYNVIPGEYTPKIVLSTSHYIIPTRENEGPTFASALLKVFNLNGGCMEWELEYDMPWLFPKKTTGDVPGDTELLVNAVGVTYGTVYDTLLVHAPSASNSPQAVTFELKVWKLAGDFNWDGIIDISDIVLMVLYFFADGDPPQPEKRAADVDCDYDITISDVVLLVDYMFKNGQILCGNPY